MRPKHLAFFAAVATLLGCGGCGHTTNDQADWSCAVRAELPICECSLADAAVAPDSSPVDTCAAWSCCFAYTDRCVCYGNVGNLLTDCSLIQAPGASPVSSCPRT